MSNSVSGLFKNKEITFWVFQIIGWFGYFMVRIFGGLTTGMTPDVYWRLSLAAMSVGFILSIFMRYIYRNFQHKSLILVLLVSLTFSGLAGLLFSSFELAVATWVMDEFPRYGWERFGNAMFEATVMLAWTALYFGYHFYENFQLERENAIRSSAMAHQAQLQMLRYQLNPHFLFNTLNAISTLVLEKATADANEMLTKLASFLRYTLVNQPTQRVSLDQELYSLSLYLDIEKVRFAERLNIVYSIEDKAKSALIPSLILQPLIENSIKYAIAPSIDGGRLKIEAKIKDSRLHLSVIDNGPGLQNVNNIVSSSGSGVGLANTKERLKQLYPSNHRFKVENRQEGGLEVSLILPFQQEK